MSCNVKKRPTALFLDNPVVSVECQCLAQASRELQPTTAEEILEESPVPAAGTAKSKKLAISRSSSLQQALKKDSSSDSDSELLESGKEMKGYRVVGCENPRSSSE